MGGACRTWHQRDARPRRQAQRWLHAWRPMRRRQQLLRHAGLLLHYGRRLLKRRPLLLLLHKHHALGSHPPRHNRPCYQPGRCPTKLSRQRATNKLCCCRQGAVCQPRRCLLLCPQLLQLLLLYLLLQLMQLLLAIRLRHRHLRPGRNPRECRPRHAAHKLYRPWLRGLLSKHASPVCSQCLLLRRSLREGSPRCTYCHRQRRLRPASYCGLLLLQKGCAKGCWGRSGDGRRLDAEGCRPGCWHPGGSIQAAAAPLLLCQTVLCRHQGSGRCKHGRQPRYRLCLLASLCCAAAALQTWGGAWPKHSPQPTTGRASSHLRSTCKTGPLKPTAPESIAGCWPCQRRCTPAQQAPAHAAPAPPTPLSAAACRAPQNRRRCALTRPPKSPGSLEAAGSGGCMPTAGAVWCVLQGARSRDATSRQREQMGRLRCQRGSPNRVSAGQAHTKHPTHNPLATQPACPPLRRG